MTEDVSICCTKKTCERHGGAHWVYLVDWFCISLMKNGVDVIHYQALNKTFTLYSTENREWTSLYAVCMHTTFERGAGEVSHGVLFCQAAICTCPENPRPGCFLTLLVFCCDEAWFVSALTAEWPWASKRPINCWRKWCRGKRVPSKETPLVRLSSSSGTCCQPSSCGFCVNANYAYLLLNYLLLL